MQETQERVKVLKVLKTVTHAPVTQGNGSLCSVPASRSTGAGRGNAFSPPTTPRGGGCSLYPTAGRASPLKLQQEELRPSYYRWMAEKNGY